MFVSMNEEAVINFYSFIYVSVAGISDHLVVGYFTHRDVVWAPMTIPESSNKSIACVFPNHSCKKYSNQ